MVPPDGLSATRDILSPSLTASILDGTEPDKYEPGPELILPETTLPFFLICVH